MRHQHRDLSILDFPLAYGRVIPATDSATLAQINQGARRAGSFRGHRRPNLAAMVASIDRGDGWLTIVGFWLWVRQEAKNSSLLPNLSRLWLCLVIIQITLGGWTILSNKAADIATAHVAFGAITFATGVVISALLIRSHQLAQRSQPVPTRPQLAEAAA